MEWLLFSYLLPPEPSRKRVSVWRQLKKLGALSTEGSGWLLPNMGTCKNDFSDLAHNVEEMEGAVNLYYVNHFSMKQENRTIEKFQQERQKEYSELIAECHKALKHIEWESDRGEFNFEEVEELEGDVEKIKRWLTNVEKRDFFRNSVRSEVDAMLVRVEESLAAFTERTWEETDKPGDSELPG